MFSPVSAHEKGQRFSHQEECDVEDTHSPLRHEDRGDPDVEKPTNATENARKIG